MKFRRVSFVAIVMGLISLYGCSSPAEKAQKLYDAGEYQKILDEFPNEPVAKQARLALADQYIKDGKYQEVLEKFPDITSAVAVGRAMLAADLLKQEKYSEILEKYPDSPASLQAREHVAQELYNAGKLDEVANKFPNTAAGRTTRNKLAEEAFERAKDLKGDARKKAVEAILTNKLYAGTDVFPDVQDEYARLSR